MWGAERSAPPAAVADSARVGAAWVDGGAARAPDQRAGGGAAADLGPGRLDVTNTYLG